MYGYNVLGVIINGKKNLLIAVCQSSFKETKMDCKNCIHEKEDLRKCYSPEVKICAENSICPKCGCPVENEGHMHIKIFCLNKEKKTQPFSN